MGEADRERNAELIDQLTRTIGHWKLTLPAAFLLQIVRPLSVIASHGVLLGQPLLSFFMEETRVAAFADLLADRASIDRLVAQLEGVRVGEEKG
jgi:hypothetical protein